MKKYIEAKDLLGQQLLGWKAYIEDERLGNLVWTGHNEDIRIYGTPNFTEEGQVSFDVQQEDNYNTIITLNFPVGTSLEVQQKMYFDALKVIIWHLEDILNTYKQ